MNRIISYVKTAKQDIPDSFTASWLVIMYMCYYEMIAFSLIIPFTKKEREVYKKTSFGKETKLCSKYIQLAFYYKSLEFEYRCVYE